MNEPVAYHPNKNSISVEQKDQLLSYLNDKLEIDFSQYSESSVRRRISKILMELKFSDVEEYIKYLDQQPNPREVFIEKFTVNVTEMFRDPFFYSCFGRLIQQLASEKDHIKIWSAGCSSGEEILSLAILLKENNLLHKASILGTDLSAAILDLAKSKTYKHRHIANYEESYKEAGGKFSLEKYYSQDGENVIFHDDLYHSISFMENDLMTTPPASDFDIIICRNVLIYFNPQLQNSILGKFCTCLNDGGHLILGSKESIIFFEDRNAFVEIEPESSIYKKVK
ncbi:CheR family methyltransferase [Owenweeksia hongkongensis]|uniref:protein-glutamate O-methyltransferase n=1 Tax=Owenweeksia hongkongensis (strain DSM 17368 / CIP 108786 / JCM 12287 / NRRL B-23963 / UST20020801) TaxID=926562 RepID=G8R6N2_OWEHD|nr:protein-glutamate O-methyltransferase CheR [Owenweeksia hongkongensis]AEV31175.1 methylase of chemotaxis methyl-accepting protein [Owenweeksia hongkongensis DSM 17368]